MRVLISGGGTAGHINPAIAIAIKIKEIEPSAKILFVGTAKGLEAKLVPQEGFEIRYITISGLKRKLSYKNIVIIKRALSAISDAKKIIKEFSPDIVVGTGGYVSGPVLFAAQNLGIKTVVHEQNAFWGITTRLLARKADKILLSFDPQEKQMKRYKNIVITGNPIREEMLKLESQSARRVLGMDARPLILSFGGSLGAKRINQAVCEMLHLSEKEEIFNFIHGTGKRDYEWFKENFALQKPNIRISEYIYDMPRVMVAADIIICRAGAITLAEIAALGKPSILIPSPNVAENHQYHNAKVFEDKKAAILLEDRALNGELLYEKIKELAEDNHQLSQMSKNAKALARPNALKDICESIFSLTKEKR
jgi:UDP-N-acetylglucosamine--N-acetylmuramyl-(pentapeptide) pyrophosphoryl-undecaprenol N-acetylglucosamine transferase